MTKTISGAGCRRKGHNFEREIAQRFAAIYPGYDVRRGLQYRDGADCPDVLTPYWWIECKRGRKPNWRGAWAQAQEASCKQNELKPIAICKDDCAEPVAILALDVLMDMLGELQLYHKTFGRRRPKGSPAGHPFDYVSHPAGDPAQCPDSETEVTTTHKCVDCGIEMRENPHGWTVDVYDPPDCNPPRYHCGKCSEERFKKYDR